MRQTGNAPVTYRDLWRSFLPLAAVPLLIASTHTMTDAALARLPSPELTLAAFAVVKSLTNMIKAPELMLLQAAAALVGDRQSLRLVARFGTALVALFVLLMLLLTFTPAGGWLLQSMMGLRGATSLEMAYTALRVVCFLPLVEALRNFLQGLLIRSGRTRILALGTLTRVLVIALFLSGVVRGQVLSGIVTASVTWTGGIALEALLLLAYAWWHRREPLPPGPAPARSLAAIGHFFSPLALMVTLTFGLQPLIHAGIARSGTPTQMLAAYSVAWGLVFLLTGPVGSLHQCVLLFASDEQEALWQRVLSFCVLVGAATSALLLLVVATPAGGWLVRHALGVPEPLVAMVLATLWAFLPLPIIRGWREAYWGVLLRRQTTGVIGRAKAANLVTVGVVLLLLFGPLRSVQPLLPCVAGALAYVLGEGVESLVIGLDAARRTREPVGAVQPMASGR